MTDPTVDSIGESVSDDKSDVASSDLNNLSKDTNNQSKEDGEDDSKIPNHKLVVNIENEKPNFKNQNISISTASTSGKNVLPSNLEQQTDGNTRLYPKLEEGKNKEKQPITTQKHEDFYSGDNKPPRLNITIGGSDLKLDQQGEKDVVVLPPDGGWGWVVVAASFMCNLLVDGIIFTTGMLFVPIMADKEFDVSYSQVAWISSLVGGFYLLAGPFVSSLANAHGFRTVCIIGAIVGSIACGISYLATGIYYLYFSYGILAGIGFGFIYVPAVITTGFYFEKKRAMATGISVCGSGIGTFTLSPLISKVIEHYGDWRPIFLVYGVLILTCVIWALAFRPLSPATGKVIDKTVELNEEQPPLLMRIKLARDEELRNCRSSISMELKTDNNVGDKLQVPNKRKRGISENFLTVPGFARKGSSDSLNYETMKPMYRSDAFFTGSMQRLPEYNRSNTTQQYLASITHIPESLVGDDINNEDLEKKCCGILPPDTMTVMAKMFDISLCKSPTFILLSLTGAMSLMSLFVPFNFLPSFISANRELLGLEEDDGTEAFVMSLIGICNTVGRILAGVISDRPKVDAIMVNNLALIIGGIATIFLPFITSVTMIYVYAVVFGLSVAFFASLRSILLVELLGLSKLTNAFGLLLLIQGIAALFGSPIAGGFADLTGDFSISFYVFGTIYALSGVLCLPLRKLKAWEDKRNNEIVE